MGFMGNNGWTGSVIFLKTCSNLPFKPVNSCVGAKINNIGQNGKTRNF